MLFFESRSLPLIIDKVQRVPELFSPVKWIVDQSEEKGRTIPIESQTYHLMKGASESLVGRIRIIEMPALSLREMVAGAKNPQKYLPDEVKERDAPTPTGFNLWEHIHRGSMPELQDREIDWDGFYSDYVRLI